MSCSRTQYSDAGDARTRNGLNWSRVKHSNIEPLRSHTELCFFLFLGTAPRRPNEKHRSPLLVHADQSLSTLTMLTAMVHAGMSDFYYFGKASRTDHHSPANCSLTQFLIFGCLLSKMSQTQFFHPFHSGDKMLLVINSDNGASDFIWAISMTTELKAPGIPGTSSSDFTRL